MANHATVLRISKILFVIVAVLAIICFVVLPALERAGILYSEAWAMSCAVFLSILFEVFLLVGALFALIVIIGYSPFRGPGKAYPCLLLMLASALVACFLYQWISVMGARAKAEESLEREQSQPIEKSPTK